MRVLVTGAEGYIGCLLGPLLLEYGHDVVGLDTGWFRDGLLCGGAGRTPAMLEKDVRDLQPGDLYGFEAIIHLGEMSNDPIGQWRPEVTRSINADGSARLATLCKQAGVRRFIYSSSCSVYGAGGSDWKTETSAVNPQTIYAECKVWVERRVSALADAEFSPVFLRNATAFGPSPRMRFDLVLNNLAGLAWTTREIRLTGDGTPWRPLAHVQDICEAMRCALEAPSEAVHNQIFNIGSTAGNYRVREIAEIVAEVFTGCRITMGTSDDDARSYRVSFDKAAAELPGFACCRAARTGAEELRALFTRIGLTAEQFSFRAFTRLRQLEYLRQTGRLDEALRWRMS